jgi:hypothetical protein
MVLCTFINLVLIVVIATFVFGIGMVGGLPSWYRNIRQGRSNCTDVQYANDATKWDSEKGGPVKPLDTQLWNLAQSVQGDVASFKQNLQTKQTECG